METVVAHLEGAYALAFKSAHYPGECVVACCGSPLILGTALPQTFTNILQLRRVVQQDFTLEHLYLLSPVGDKMCLKWYLHIW